MRRAPRLSAAAVLTLAVLCGSGCRFERRPAPENGDDVAVPDTTIRVTAESVQDSVRAVVRAFHEALRVGDGSRVASLSVQGATVVDQEEGVEWRLGPGGGERLPSPFLGSRAGLGWERVSTDFVAWRDAALLVDRHRATVAGESVPWTAVETFVLERSDGAWLIRHVHRSRGAQPVEHGRLGPADEG
ncbi:MAG: DUF4440 domain-containing protein [Gemmatimonadota bacterium]